MSLNVFIASYQVNIDNYIDVFTRNVESLSLRSKILAAIAALGGISVFGLIARIARIIYRRKRYKYPPGLFGVPFFGSFLTMTMENGVYYHKTLPSYGPITHAPGGLYMNMTFINDKHLLKSLYQFVSDRPPAFGDMNEVTGGDVSSVNESENWSQRRKLIMHGLASILDKSIVEQKMNQIMTEITFAGLNNRINKGKLESLESNEYYLWHPRKETRNAIFNIIFSAIFGLVLEANDSKFDEYQKQMTEINQVTILAFVSLVFPKILVLLTPSLRNAREMLTRQYELNTKLALSDYFDAKKRLLNKFVNNKDKNISDEEFIRNECQTLFEKMYFSLMIQGKNNVDYDDVIDNGGNIDVNKIIGEMSITERRIVSDILILFNAGMDTTSTTAERSILLLAKYPKIQETVYNVCCIVSVVLLYCLL